MKKKIVICSLAAMFAFMASSFVTPGEVASTTAPTTAPAATKFVVTTGADGEIVSVVPSDSQAGWDNSAWHIKDLSGPTNIRQSPGGKVCMKLKAHVQYEIYTNDISGSWLHISSIYNLTQKYWVRLHSSKTGNYWISQTVLY